MEPQPAAHERKIMFADSMLNEAQRHQPAAALMPIAGFASGMWQGRNSDSPAWSAAECWVGVLLESESRRDAHAQTWCHMSSPRVQMKHLRFRWSFLRNDMHP